MLRLKQEKKKKKKRKMLLAPHKPEILIFIYIFLRLQRNLEAGYSDEDGFFYSPDLSGSCGKLYFCVTKLKKKKKK